MLIDCPDRFETERLLLRSPLPGDGPELRAAIAESIDDLRPWMEWAERVPTPEEAEINVRQARCRFLERTDLRLHLYLKGTDTLVGCSGLHRIDWQVPRFEIGYWCRSGFTGQGYIIEAVRGVTRFAFATLGAERLEIRMDSRNERSRRVAERAGYRLEATLRRNERAVDGSLRDTLVFALLRSEWEAAQNP
jgi:RimJ/RimL family protein N-acetyltransferase